MRLRLFWAVLSVEGRKLMSYRADFWITAAIAFLTEFALVWAVWKGLFALQPEGAELGGYPFEGMVLYSVTAILLARLIRGQERDPGMSQDVYEGALSRYLLYPCDYFFTKYAQALGFLFPASVQLVIFVATAALLIPVPAEMQPSLATIGQALPALALANFLWFLMLFPIHAVAFWADNVWTLRVMLRFVSDFFGGMMLPLSLFPDALAAALWWTPFPYLYALPVMTALGRPLPVAYPLALALAAGWCAVLWFVGHRIWRRGLLQYSGVGI